jgi:hypothetical protein
MLKELRVVIDIESGIINSERGATATVKFT